jgi:3',5'-cyclic AMP phosphodiesterase CpdA
MKYKFNKKLFYIVLTFLFVFIIVRNSQFSINYQNSSKLVNNDNLAEIEDLPINKGFISGHDYNIFWFIQISDTQFLWYDSDKIMSFYRFLNETYNEIEPLLIFHTGDLVDADHGTKQDQFEWELYKKALNDNKMNASFYLDVIGNHDAISDSDFNYFLNYSMMGRSFNTTQYSFNKTFDFGKYAFIGLNTAKESYNLYEFAFQGFLDSEELNWYENELEKYKNFTKIFVFGHHPPSYPPFYKIMSEESLNGKDFYELNEEYNVSYYFSGHIHENSYQYNEELLSITTTNFDEISGTYRIISLDNNSLSTSIGYVGEWPQAIITCPAREKYQSEGLNEHNKKIRVLTWDPNGIILVKWSFFDSQGELQLTKWISLTNISKDRLLWEGNLDFQYRGDILLKVQVEGLSGITTKVLKYYLKNRISTPSLIIAIIMTIGLASISITITYYFSIQTKKIGKKRKDSLLDILILN